MYIEHGNLIHMALNNKFDVIIHGANCFCTMGGGIAYKIKQIFPDAYAADLNTKLGDIGKLGTISYAVITKGVLNPIIVVNGYTQYRFGTDKMHVDYEAVRSVFKLVKEKFTGLRIGYPAIGSGLAGGDWKIISKIIDEGLFGEVHTLVLLNN